MNKYQQSLIFINSAIGVFYLKQTVTNTDSFFFMFY